MVPADEHQLFVNSLRTEARTFESFAAVEKYQDVILIQIWVALQVGRVTEREHLVKRHTERPDITLMAELLSTDRLWCVPLDGQSAGVSRVIVVAVVVGELREAEVGDFHAILVRHQDVASCQITMNDSLSLKIVHSLEKQIKE